MNKALIINAHQYYPFSEGKLNATLVNSMVSHLTTRGFETRVVTMAEPLDIEHQLDLHRWADVVILQSPINWMGLPWSFKKYMDEVYTAGMGGALCNGDGRSADQPKANYGRGGTLGDTRYMLSVTFNAPAESFNDVNEFFEGKSVDDLLLPTHMNFKFFGMQSIPTFSCFDVMKNADIEGDLARLDTHLNTYF